jgi:hypothetical protein
MPCYDGRDDAGQLHSQIAALKERLNITTRLACDYCKHLEELHCTVPAFAQAWWKEHKRIDAQRSAKEE